MKRRRVFLIVQSVLCIAAAALLVMAAVRIYQEGIAAKTADPMAWVYTPERLRKYVLPVLPVLFGAIGFSAAGLIMGIRDEQGLEPVRGQRTELRAAARREKAVRLVLLIAAVCLILAGISNGSAWDVLGKAVNICTECIGLG